jgi:hypothetical protein
MMAQAAGDLGALVKRCKSDEWMMKRSETGGKRQRNATGVRTSGRRTPQHLPRSGLVQSRLPENESAHESPNPQYRRGLLRRDGARVEAIRLRIRAG